GLPHPQAVSVVRVVDSAGARVEPADADLSNFALDVEIGAGGVLRAQPVVECFADKVGANRAFDKNVSDVARDVEVARRFGNAFDLSLCSTGEEVAAVERLHRTLDDYGARNRSAKHEPAQSD